MTATHATGVSLVVILAFASAARAQPTPDSAVVRFEGQSTYERIFVVDEGPLRYLRFGEPDGDDQSVIDLSDPRAVPVEYVRAAALGLLACGPCQRLLMIGLGGGTFTTLARRAYPLMTIDAVELDPMVVRVAERYFGLRTDPRFVVHVADGGAFLRRAERPYDLILLDAYAAEDSPPALVTEAFFRRVAASLSPEGLAVINLSMEEDLEQLVRERFLAVFAHAACLRTADDCNQMIFGRMTPLPGHAALVDAARRFGRERALGFDLATVAARWRQPCP